MLTSRPSLRYAGLLVLTAAIAGCGQVATVSDPPAMTASATAEPTPRPTRRPTPRPTPRPPPRPTESPTANPASTPIALNLPAGAVTAAEAAARVGEWVTVCGTVMSANFVADANGTPTFLNLDGVYPDHVLTLITWQEERAWYITPPEVAFTPPAQVCAAGLVEVYQGTAQVEPITPMMLLADWTSLGDITGDLECEALTEPSAIEICSELQAELDQLSEDAYYDSLDDVDAYYDDLLDDYYYDDPYAP